MTLFRKWRIRTLQAQIQSSRRHSATLAARFQAATDEIQKARIARRFDETLKRAHSMQFRLEALQRTREKEAGEVTDS